MGKRTAVWVEIPCDNCGESFKKKEARLKYAKRHYCSLECCDKHKKSTMKGKNNHRYGTKPSEEEIERRSKFMKEQWKNQDYVDKVLAARKATAKGREHPIGWDPETREKRIATLLERYGASHNWSDKECREKCEQTTIERHGRPSVEIAREAIDTDTIERRRRTLVETVSGVSYEAYEAKLEGKEKYYKRVRRLTEQQPLHLLENFEKRGRLDTGEGAYHLDHIVPVSYGWINGIPEEIIADISNLRFIPGRDNIIKGAKHLG